MDCTVEKKKSTFRTWYEVKDLNIKVSFLKKKGKHLRSEHKYTLISIKNNLGLWLYPVLGVEISGVTQSQRRHKLGCGWHHDVPWSKQTPCASENNSIKETLCILWLLACLHAVHINLRNNEAEIQVFIWSR